MRINTVEAIQDLCTRLNERDISVAINYHCWLYGSQGVIKLIVAEESDTDIENLIYPFSSLSEVIDILENNFALACALRRKSKEFMSQTPQPVVIHESN